LNIVSIFTVQLLYQTCTVSVQTVYSQCTDNNTQI